MSTGRVRRAQLVSPFGVGAMSTLVNGTSVITAGLDHWYATDDPTSLYPDEYVVDEWRLQERLRVKELRLPPEHRLPRPGSAGQRNINLAVPVLRFPRWSFCMYCKRLEASTLSLSESARCPDPAHRAAEGAVAKHWKPPVMSQVPFVVICERGHLDDFPWSQWVHRELVPSCDGVLRLVSRGGGTLAGQVVSCSACERERPLEGVTTAKPVGDHESTVLTQQLSREGEFACVGSRPWVADPGSGCGNPLRAALRGAGNVYFPLVESSIFLPRRQGGARAEVLDILRRADVQPLIQLLQELLPALTAAQVRTRVKPELLHPFSDEELDAGLAELFSGGPASHSGGGDGDELTGSAEWRRPEYEILRTNLDHPDLKVNDPGVPASLAEVISAVRRIEILRETRVLRGFTRVRHGSLRLSEGKALLRRKSSRPERDWLPAYVVRGEGIYLELHPGALGRWETNPDVQARAGRMAARFGAIQQSRGLRYGDVSARFVLLHTLAHLLINELVYTCGYSSAALRERLYVSSTPGHGMAGMLIYTAAGDSEGTMGGLVRMGQPENLLAVMTAAIAKARWCSTDPVCMELGEAGQGPNSCNMAACHGCALVPETSCEEFNHFLDRGLVTGTFARPDLGFLATMLDTRSGRWRGGGTPKLVEAHHA